MNEKRIRLLKDGAKVDGPVVYWMSRDQRVDDNWALLYAQKTAKINSQKLIVVFCLVPNFLEATIRQYGFMLKGLQKVEEKLKKLNISFFLLEGDPISELPEYLNKY